MIAKVTAPDLAQDVAGAEALLSRHQEHRAETVSYTHLDVYKRQAR